MRDLSVSDHTLRRFGYHECCSNRRILASEKRFKERMGFLIFVSACVLMSRLEGISARDGALVWGLNCDSV